MQFFETMFSWEQVTLDCLLGELFHKRIMKNIKQQVVSCTYVQVFTIATLNIVL